MTDAERLTALHDAIASIGPISVDELSRPVPSCPKWDVAGLVGHIGRVHRYATEILRKRATSAETLSIAPRPDGDAVIDYFHEGAQGLLDAVRDADLDEELFTWVGPRPARWWLRRQLHETAVHAWDANNARDRVSPIPAAVAVDGIDELFDVFVPARFDQARFGGAGETMHLHATDADGEWLVRFQADSVEVAREHGKGDVAARGPASDLLLFVWSRSGTEPLETFGDTTILDRFQAAAAF